MKWPGKVIDISAVLGNGAPAYPGDPAFIREEISKLEDGESCTLSGLSMCAHSGTHIDTPSHFIPGGKTLDDYPPERFVLDAQVVEVEGDTVRRAAFTDLGDWRGQAILFKTANSTEGLMRSGDYTLDYVALSAGAAETLAAGGAALVGIDYLSIDLPGSGAHPAHMALLKSDCLILEGIDLGEVSPGTYTLICLPLRISGGEASPVRAVLIEKN